MVVRIADPTPIAIIDINFALYPGNILIPPLINVNYSFSFL